MLFSTYNKNRLYHLQRSAEIGALIMLLLKMFHLILRIDIHVLIEFKYITR